jgi:hypothetical protein
MDDEDSDTLIVIDTNAQDEQTVEYFPTDGLIGERKRRLATHNEHKNLITERPVDMKLNLKVQPYGHPEQSFILYIFFNKTSSGPLEATSRNSSSVFIHQNHTPIARRVTSPIHESCTACIVRVAKGTSAMISGSDVEHLADSASGPSGCPCNRETPDSKVQKA